MDFTRDEIRYLLDLSHDLKAKKRAGLPSKTLEGKNIVLLFEKPSTRTRCAFETAALDEGAHVTFLDQSSSQMNKKESLEDTARVLGRYYDSIEYRGYAQATVEALARFSGVPVYNGLTDVDHPTQILADLMTMEERLHKPLEKAKVVFVGDTRNNISLAWSIACAKLGMDFVGLGPKELHPDAAALTGWRRLAEESGGSLTFTDTVEAAVRDADAVYTDVWVSMGEESKMAERVKVLTPYRVDQKLLEQIGGPDCIFMHCLPAFHDWETATAQKAKEAGLDIREVTDEVFRGPRSVVFDEAENRLHTIKAVLVATLR
jgi:ornithine carbamoyltransferase